MKARAAVKSSLLAEDEFDLLVIGGGVTGAGIALDAALRGLRTALLEQPVNDAERHAQERMRQMHDLIDRLMTWFDDVQKLAPETAMQLMGMGATVTRVLEFKDRMTGKTARNPAEQ